MSWRDFWNGEHKIYVNARHHRLHFELIGRDICDLIESPSTHMLDYGCGEAGASNLIAKKCEGLLLFDTAPNVRAKLLADFASNPKIRILDEAALANIEAHSLDLVVINSVLQYLSHGECMDALILCKSKLKPQGRLIIGDVIPKESGALGDTKALLSFALHGGFFIAACLGLLATFFSDYRKLRSSIGLTRYSEDEAFTLLSKQGFKAERASHNIGHNQTRMTFIAKPQA
jgi:SAM-dependent methyltransferase